ncbi:MAG: hypothetical protein K0R01_1175 [Mycobacterium sp.]|jgi:hypothetical protein|nr:hypothetical protein [Mycobacterium sp.]
MTTPPTPAGRYPEPDDSESTGHAAHPVEPERFELPTFETFETPPFESISSGSFETPPAPPPSPAVTGEPLAPAAPEPPSAPEVPEPPAFITPPPVAQATHAAYGQSHQQQQVTWHDPSQTPAPAVPTALKNSGAGRARLVWLGLAAILLVILAVVLYLVLT